MKITKEYLREKFYDEECGGDFDCFSAMGYYNIRLNCAGVECGSEECLELIISKIKPTSTSTNTNEYNIELSKEDWEAFVKELQSPPKYNHKLAEILKKPLIFEKDINNEVMKNTCLKCGGWIVQGDICSKCRRIEELEADNKHLMDWNKACIDSVAIATAKFANSLDWNRELDNLLINLKKELAQCLGLKYTHTLEEAPTIPLEDLIRVTKEERLNRLWKD